MKKRTKETEYEEIKKILDPAYGSGKTHFALSVEVKAHLHKFGKCVIDELNLLEQAEPTEKK